MRRLFASEKIYIGKSKIRNAGMGVFAKRNIKKGDIVERVPFIEISGSIDKNDLHNYVFHFGAKKERKALALGFGSIYNHSGSPNIKFKIKEKEKIIEFTAIINIKKDEELSFDYHGSGNVGKKTKLWFET